MAESQSMTTAEVVAKTLIDEHADFLREAVALVANRLMEAEISSEIGAARGEVSTERTTHRNGYRPRPWETRVGEIELLVPRKRSGSAYFPTFLEPRRRSEQAIVCVVLEAYVNGVSTRKVDRLVEQLGVHGMTKDRVSRLCRALDEQVEAFLSRSLEGDYPYLWLDAKQLKVRDRGHVYSKALVIAYAVHASGVREVIGLDLGEVESEAFWVEFLRQLKRRGLAGVRLCVSDHHEGLKSAIARLLACPWQRCTVHFVRNMHQHCRPSQRGLVSAALREVFNAGGRAEARDRCGEVIGRLQKVAPKVAEAARGRRGGPRRVLCLPGATLVEASLDQPARARQPRDRPPQRRRRDLPQRPGRDPPRRRSFDRAKRRVARQPPLPVHRVARPRPRGSGRPRAGGGERARAGLSRQRYRRA
jgi:putative transposase